MKIDQDSIYHIYNRGNQQQLIFFEERNYAYFKQKIQRELLPHLDFLAYCLMPNHFHFLVYAREDFEMSKFSKGLRVLLSSYTRAIQKQESFTGSLFQQNTKAKELTTEDYVNTCFHYIHQNPLRAKLVTKIEDWKYHSFNEYWKEDSDICNISLGRELLSIPLEPEHFYNESYEVIPENILPQLD